MKKDKTRQEPIFSMLEEVETQGPEDEAFLETAPGENGSLEASPDEAVESGEDSTERLEVYQDGGEPAFRLLVDDAFAASLVSNSLGMLFVYIRPGSFMMGSFDHESGRERDEARHEVTLTRGFYMLTTQVTQDQWKSVMGSNPSSFSSNGEDCPVESVTWEDCQHFIATLNSRGEGLYRLPTEAEWEYACRAGSITAFANGRITSLVCGHDPYLDAMGWYCGNSARSTHPVGKKNPNMWGIYDMHGNVAEWCEDWYGEYPSGPQADPAGPSSGVGKIIRGGAWFSSARNCRSASRSDCPPNFRSDYVGFRLVMDEK